MKQRYEAPAMDNKWYLRPEAGGYNKCIEISGGSVLPNCVGYSFGRFMEAAGITSCSLSRGNAENWWSFTADGYQRGQEPKPGAVACWRKGVAGDSSDGMGHVEIVEQVNDDGSIVTTGSNYSGKRWYRHTRQKPYSIAGQVFQGFIYNPYIRDDVVKLENGYQKIDIDGHTAHVYKQSGNEKLALIADIWGKKSDIRDFEIPGKRIKAAINCSFFAMNGDQGYLGRCQGFRNHTGAIVDDRPPAPSEMGQTGPKSMMDYVIYPTGKVVIGDMYSWDRDNKAGDLVGFSPAGIQIINGQKTNQYSPGVGYDKINTAHKTTALMRSADGHWVFVVIPESIKPVPDLQAWALSNGFTEMCTLDGGDSSQMAVSGKAVCYTGRYIPVVLVLYEDAPTEAQAPADESKPQDPTTVPDPKDEPQNAANEPTQQPQNTGINWAQKLSSRKLWLALISILVGGLIKFGLPETYANSVTSALLIVLPALAYILTEGLIDAARAKGQSTETLEQIAQALLDALGEKDNEQ